MKILDGEDAQEIAEPLFTGLVDLAMALEAIDMDDLIEHTNPPLKEVFLAGAEFKSSMAPILEARRAMH